MNEKELTKKEKELNKREKKIKDKEELMSIKEYELNKMQTYYFMILALMIIGMIVVAIYNYNLVRGV